MKGTMTLIVGPPKCGKAALASFLVTRDTEPACIQDWNCADAETAKAVLGELAAKVEEGWHVIVTATMANGRPFGPGTPVDLLAAADRLIEIRSYYGVEMNHE